jgi:hypothetical protein
MAVPTGVAFIGLGISLWRSQHSPATPTTAPAYVEQAHVR